MTSDQDPLSQLVEIAEEQLRWQRASALPNVRLTIAQALTTIQMRRAYEMCDGETASTDIADAVGASKSTISSWTRRWRDAGIAYEVEGRRIKHLASLDSLGLPLDAPEGG